MRINEVVILNDFGIVNGGASKVAIESALALDRIGYNVTYLCGKSPVDYRLYKSQISVIELNQKELAETNIAKGIINGIWNFKAYKIIKNLLRSKSKENTVVIVHSFSKVLSPSIIFTLAKSNIRTIMILHDYFSACPNGGFFNYQTNKLCSLVPMSIGCVCSNCDKKNYIYKIFRISRQIIIKLCLSLHKNIERIYCF